MNQRSLNFAEKIYENLKGLVIHKFRLKVQSSQGDVEAILRCIVSGFFMNIA